MATKPDLKAQKERKQKMILAVGGVLLAGVLVLQLPKLLKHPSSTSAAPPATVTTPGDVTPSVPSVTPSSPSAPVNVSASKTSAQLAGVVLAPAKTPDAVQGQLWSFSRFKAKDPFVPQVTEGGSSGATTASSGTSAAPTTTGGAPGTAGAGGTATIAAPPAYATLLVNGRPQQLTLKQLFPKADPIFVLAKLIGENARIAVAGGSFTAGNTVLLQLGKKVTLMNTTTGQRYVVKLVYVGAQPETLAAFKGGTTAPATAGSPTTVTAIPGTVP